MTYDPRAPHGTHPGSPQPPPPQRPPQPLTFGQVFWACFLALLVWGVLAWLLIAALLEDAGSDF